MKLMNENLSCLSAAIADAGHWHWWKAWAPEQVQLEFVGVRLYQAPANLLEAPCSQLAVIFNGVRSAQFLDFAEDRPLDWPERIERDELRGGELIPDSFVLGDSDCAGDIVSQALRSREVVKPVNVGNLDAGLIACAFQTINQVGVFVVAENVELLGKSGPIPLEALPLDMNCEISFPAGPLEDMHE